MLNLCVQIIDRIMTKFQDKCRGALVGGAIGDALGYAVEFDGSFAAIQTKYGKDGITQYALVQGEALVSDDTQMSLYTAEGLLEAERTSAPLLPAVSKAYLAWLGPQIGRMIDYGYKSDLIMIDELNQRRAPGITCMTALSDIAAGRSVSNDSKGCGGVMRVAPVGVYGAAKGWELEQTARFAGEVAELTHRHPLSTYPSAALAVMVQECIQTEGAMTAECFRAVVDSALDVVCRVYGADAHDMPYFVELMRRAVELADSSTPDWQIIERRLGGGWVAEETLAIAVFAVLRHIDNFDACMIGAVNHGGDSDSTGAVAGNILGAIMGYEALPTKYTDRLQLRDLIIRSTDALVQLR